MIRSSIRSAGLAILLTMNGCGDIVSSATGARTPGLNVAEAALQGGAGQIALQVSDGVLRDSPNNIHALEIKGDALTLLGDYDGAAAIFQQLLAKDPNSIRARIGLGRVSLSKDPAAAEALFQQVLTHAPSDMTALNNLGIARDLQGHHAEAQTAYRQALAVNPDLESAQVNLALSMAMSGHGPEAIALLKDKAVQPGAPVKVRHDYAVVLAMAGNRAEAERVLGDDLSPDEVRQVLDSVTGTHTRLARDGQTSQGGAALASRQWGDDVPPDVVQVPEAAAQPTLSRTARSQTGPATADFAAAATPAAMAAPPPMVVRPRLDAESASDTPVMQPVSPIGAAVANERTLALPLPSTNSNTAASGPARDAAIATPVVVAMPAAAPRQRLASSRDPAADAGQAVLPDAPPAPPALPPMPLPPGYQSPAAAARVEPSARPVATAAEATPPDGTRPEGTRPEGIRSEPAQTIGQAARSAPMTATMAVTVARAAPEAPANGSAGAGAAMAAAVTHAVPEAVVNGSAATEGDPANASAGIARPDDTTPMVQFVAAPSEESAHSVWQDLVHRFPDALGQREPLVIRYERGGTVFWRLRAEGFGTVAEAQTLCARLRAGGQDCFVPRS
jgi:Flp pilus assembly protein TadD